LNLKTLSLSVRADRIGTIKFSPEDDEKRRWNRGRPNLDIDLSAMTFYDIEDARNVYQLIQAQREQKRSA
jgi:hypothetical protein